MIDDLTIDRYQIIRAAEGMISNHGSDALAEANRRAHNLTSEGLASAATWALISRAIKGLQVTDPKEKGAHGRSQGKCFSFDEYYD